jgi:hypothetical protein
MHVHIFANHVLKLGFFETILLVTPIQYMIRKTLILTMSVKARCNDDWEAGLHKTRGLQ